MALPTGQVVNNRYRIVKLLGQGGFGAVYRAWDLNMERPRALKENLETSPEAQRQFKREAQILGDLTHPNLTKVIDHFVIPEQGQYLVMEFVEGDDLEATLANQGEALPETQVLPWIIQICDALSYLHAQQPPIIHRDIKPANIKVRSDGRAILVDFGIAKTYNPKLSTTVGARAVTPGFSPQEQYGLGTTDVRTDIYALGATLYNLVTGNYPPESVQRNLDIHLIPPRKVKPEISVSTEAAILKAMEMHPGQRFQTIEAFRAALSAALDEKLSPAVEKVNRPPGWIADPAESPPPAVEKVNRPSGWIADPTESPPPAAVRQIWGSVPEYELQDLFQTPNRPAQPEVTQANPLPAAAAQPAASAQPMVASTGLSPIEPVPWQLIAVQSAGLLLTGILTVVNRGVYLGDNIFELVFFGYYLLVCLLVIIDGVRLSSTNPARKRFEIAFGSAAFVLPIVLPSLMNSDDPTEVVILFSTVVIGNGLLLLALKTRDWRTGLLGAIQFPLALQILTLVQENWDGNWELALFYGMAYLATGAVVLMNVRPPARPPAAVPAAGAALPAEPVKWWWLAILSAALALAGILMILTDLLDIWDLDLLESAILGIFYLTCGLLVVDALTLRQPGGLLRRSFELAFPPLAIFLYLILFEYDYNQGNTVFVLSMIIMAAFILGLAWKTADRRLGILGALYFPPIAQAYWWLMPENWDAIAATAIFFGGVYLLVGGAVLVRTLMRRR